jgi:hypothetical protein
VIHQNAAKQKAGDAVRIEPAQKGFINLLNDLYPAVLANRNTFAHRLFSFFFERSYDPCRTRLG